MGQDEEWRRRFEALVHVSPDFIAVSNVDGKVEFRALLQHLSDLLIVLSVNRTVLYASPSTTRILGYGEGRWEGEDVLDLVHPEDRSRVADAVHDLATTADAAATATLDVRLLSSDGKALPYEARLDTVRDDTGVASIVLAARQLRSPTLVHAVREAVQVLEPWSLTWEFAESALREDTELIHRMVEALALTAGFSSLAYGASPTGPSWQ